MLPPGLTLRPITDEDIDWVFRGLSNPEVIRYYGVSYISLEDTRDQMHFFKEIEANETGKWWAIERLSDRQILGAAGVNHIQKIHKKGEIGYWLFPEYWAQGLSKTVIPMICEDAFGRMGLHRIEAVVEQENTASAKALLACGFTHEGLMRDAEWKPGRWISLDIYSLLAPEWNAQKLNRNQKENP
jgi:[ribosomal protein S5]-alanine N-acetyltransferase